MKRVIKLILIQFLLLNLKKDSKMADRIAVLVVLEFIWISLNIVGLTAEATTDGDDIIKQHEAIDSLLQQSGGAVSS